MFWGGWIACCQAAFDVLIYPFVFCCTQRQCIEPPPPLADAAKAPGASTPPTPAAEPSIELNQLTLEALEGRRTPEVNRPQQHTGDTERSEVLTEPSIPSTGRPNSRGEYPSTVDPDLPDHPPGSEAVEGKDELKSQPTSSEQSTQKVPRRQGFLQHRPSLKYFPAASLRVRQRIWRNHPAQSSAERALLRKDKPVTRSKTDSKAGQQAHRLTRTRNKSKSIRQRARARSLTSVKRFRLSRRHAVNGDLTMMSKTYDDDAVQMKTPTGTWTQTHEQSEQHGTAADTTKKTRIEPVQVRQRVLSRMLVDKAAEQESNQAAQGTGAGNGGADNTSPAKYPKKYVFQDDSPVKSRKASHASGLLRDVHAAAEADEGKGAAAELDSTQRYVNQPGRNLSRLTNHSGQPTQTSTVKPRDESDAASNMSIGSGVSGYYSAYSTAKKPDWLRGASGRLADKSTSECTVIEVEEDNKDAAFGGVDGVQERPLANGSQAGSQGSSSTETSGNTNSEDIVVAPQPASARRHSSSERCFPTGLDGAQEEEPTLSQDQQVREADGSPASTASWSIMTDKDLIDFLAFAAAKEIFRAKRISRENSKTQSTERPGSKPPIEHVAADEAGQGIPKVSVWEKALHEHAAEDASILQRRPGSCSTREKERRAQGQARGVSASLDSLSSLDKSSHSQPPLSKDVQVHLELSELTPRQASSRSNRVSPLIGGFALRSTSDNIATWCKYATDTSLARNSSPADQVDQGPVRDFASLSAAPRQTKIPSPNGSSPTYPKRKWMGSLKKVQSEQFIRLKQSVKNLSRPKSIEHMTRFVTDESRGHQSSISEGDPFVEYPELEMIPTRPPPQANSPHLKARQRGDGSLDEGLVLCPSATALSNGSSRYPSDGLGAQTQHSKQSTTESGTQIIHNRVSTACTSPPFPPQRPFSPQHAARRWSQFYIDACVTHPPSSTLSLVPDTASPASLAQECRV